MRVLLLFWLLLLPVGAAPDRTAMITDLIGEARLGGRPVKTLQVLASGSEVEVPANARISLIFFGDSHLETLTGPCRIQIAPREARLLAGEPAQRATRAPTAMRVPSRGERAETMGGTVQRAPYSGLTMPRALVANPVFTWTGIKEPMVVMVTRAGPATEVLWQSPPSDSGVAYRGPALEPDQAYVWELWPAGGSTVGEPPFAPFTLLSPASVEAIRAAESELRAAAPEDVSARVMMMQVYAEHMLLEEALAAAREALTLRPGDPGLEEAENRLLRELGRPET